MTGVPDSFPDDGDVFEGNAADRFLAVALETVVQDVSPVGDGDAAKRLGEYTLGANDPPADVPEYVELEDGGPVLSNPPFLLADIDVVRDEEYVLEVGFDSELDLLIDPPVEVTIEGEFRAVLETLEQMIAEIYRTRGRRLEMIDAGTVDVEAFAQRR